MNLSALAGNEALKRRLEGLEAGRGLSHAWLISGPAGSGRRTLATLLAQAFVCQAPGERPCGQCPPCRKVIKGIHPDVSPVFGQEGKSVTVEQVRALRAGAHIRPNEGRRRVYLLDLHRMNAAGQNAMLKVLEEGPAYAVFLLLCENENAVLETIRSRCQRLSLSPVSPAQAEEYLRKRFPGEASDRLRRAALDCQGLLGRAVEELEGWDEKARARQELAQALAGALESGDELELFLAAMPLEKLKPPELRDLLVRLEGELGRRLPSFRDKRRLLRAEALLDELRGAAEVNVTGGSLSGWLCAGMFD